MKLKNIYQMDANKKRYWEGNNYLVGITKTGCYETDGRALNWWANKIYEKLDYYKYFNNLLKQLPLIKSPNRNDNRSLLYSIFKNAIVQEIKRSIYWFKETGKHSLSITKNNIEDLIKDNCFKMFYIKDYEEIQKQGILIYDCFMGNAFKELEKIKFRFKDWDWKEKRRILWEEKYLNSNNKSKTQTKKSNKTLKMRCK